MANMINIIDCGVTEIAYEGKIVKLPNELILFAADEIRARFRKDVPDVPTPAGPISQPQPARRQIPLLCSILGHKHIIQNNNVAEPAICQRCGHETEAVEWPKI